MRKLSIYEEKEWITLWTFELANEKKHLIRRLDLRVSEEFIEHCVQLTEDELYKVLVSELDSSFNTLVFN